jgi:vacuolar-type H+-ATPase subunit F/Vma7
MPNHIAIIGDSDFIMGFKSLDCALYPVEEKTDLRAIFQEVIEADFLCIFVLETCAIKIMDLLEQYREKTRPLIIVLPDFRADLSLTEDLLSRLTIKAVGRDITQGV